MKYALVQSIAQHKECSLLVLNLLCSGALGCSYAMCVCVQSADTDKCTCQHNAIENQSNCLDMIAVTYMLDV